MKVIDFLVKHNAHLIAEYVEWNEFIVKYKDQEDFDSEIAFAIKENNMEIIKHLLQSKNKNTEDEFILEIAAEIGNLEVFKYILANVNYGFRVDSKVLNTIFEYRNFNILGFLLNSKIYSYEEIFIASLFNKNAKNAIKYVQELQQAPYGDISIEKLKTTMFSYISMKTQDINMVQDNMRYLSDSLIELLSRKIELDKVIAEYKEDLIGYSEKDAFNQLDISIEEINIFLKVMNAFEKKDFETVKRILKKSNGLNMLDGRVSLVNLTYMMHKSDLVDILISNSEKFIYNNKSEDPIMKEEHTLVDIFIQEFDLLKVDENIDVAFDRTKEICSIFNKYFPEENDKLEKFIVEIERKKNFEDINEDQIPF